jgi:hypothetical protein
MPDADGGPIVIIIIIISIFFHKKFGSALLRGHTYHDGRGGEIGQKKKECFSISLIFILKIKENNNFINSIDYIYSSHSLVLFIYFTWRHYRHDLDLKFSADMEP